MHGLTVNLDRYLGYSSSVHVLGSGRSGRVVKGHEPGQLDDTSPLVIIPPGTELSVWLADNGNEL